MRPILYLETNVIVGVAKGQDPEGWSLLDGTSDDFRLVIPSACVMEAFSVLEAEKKQWRTFRESLTFRSREWERNQISLTARTLTDQLGQAIVSGSRWINEFEDHLYGVLEDIRDQAEFIETDYHVLNDGLLYDHLDDPTDNLILCGVLHHARRNPTEPKAFLSGNHKDFGQPEVQSLLKGAGVFKYFQQAKHAIGWAGSLGKQDPGPAV